MRTGYFRAILLGEINGWLGLSQMYARSIVWAQVSECIQKDVKQLRPVIAEAARLILYGAIASLVQRYSNLKALTRELRRNVEVNVKPRVQNYQGADQRCRSVCFARCDRALSRVYSGGGHSVAITDSASHSCCGLLCYLGGSQGLITRYLKNQLICRQAGSVNFSLRRNDKSTALFAKTGLFNAGLAREAGWDNETCVSAQQRQIFKIVRRLAFYQRARERVGHHLKAQAVQSSQALLPEVPTAADSRGEAQYAGVAVFGAFLKQLRQQRVEIDQYQTRRVVK